MELLKKVYHSTLLKSIRRNIYFIDRFFCLLKDTYYFRGEYITSTTFWRIHRLLISHKNINFNYFTRNKYSNIQLGFDKNLLIIPTSRIIYCIPSSKRYKKNKRKIQNGNWDLDIIKLEDDSFYKLLKKNYTKNGFNKLDIELNIHKSFEIKKYFKKYKLLNTLYNNIKIHENNGIYNFNDNYQKAVRVQIGRDGKFILEKGLCRIFLYKIFGIKEIRVNITRRHYLWSKFRKEVFLYSKEVNGVYQQVTHPDFQFFKFQRGEDRWDTIYSNLPFESGSVLDLGSNWGYFCHKFEDIGFQPCAVEINQRWLYYLNYLKKIENKKFNVINSSMFNIEKLDYDIVLALSIFHNLLTSKDNFNKLTTFLGEINTKAMFFEPHAPNELPKGSIISFSEQEFVDYVIKYSCLSHSKLLGRNNRGRNMYLLTR